MSAKSGLVAVDLFDTGIAKVFLTFGHTVTYT